MGYDVIGDVHGQYEKLTKLLGMLGYGQHLGALRHPEGRTAVFVGDLIDYGSGQVEVLDLVRGMEQRGSARVVMGNHELNAIGYATPSEDRMGWLREHSGKNKKQHSEFLKQVGWDSPLHHELVGWFRTLPIALDLGGIRVCHAWWNDDMIAVAREVSDADGRLAENSLSAAFCKGAQAFEVLECLTKGCEVELPEGYTFVDKSGNVRSAVRVKWWDVNSTTYRRAALVSADQRLDIPDDPLPLGVNLGNPSPVPVFVGHFRLAGRPAPQNANTAVLDYSAANGCPLVAYRWNGEPELADDGFVSVGN